MPRPHRRLVAALFLCCTALAASPARAQHTGRPAAWELLTNPELADGAFRWDLHRVDPTLVTLPDGSRALEIPGGPPHDRATVSQSVFDALPGEQLELAARVHATSPGQEFGMTIVAWTWDEDAWRELDTTYETFHLAADAWEALRMTWRAPDETQQVAVMVWHASEEPVHLQRVYLRTLDDVEEPGDGHLGGLSVPEVEAAFASWREAAVQWRGRAFEQLPSIRVISRERLRRLTTGYTPSEQQDLLTRALHLLGLLAPGDHSMSTLSSLASEGMGGTYLPFNHTLRLLGDLDVEVAGVVAVHELCHALDEEGYRSWARYSAVSPFDMDQGLAQLTVVEGGPTAIMNAYSRAEVEAGRADAGLAERVAATGIRGLLSSREGVSTWFQARSWMPYTLGPQFLAAGSAAGHDLVSAVDVTLDTPPRSTEQVLHPEAYWSTTPDEPKPVDPGDLSAPLGEGWELLASGTLGELLVGWVAGGGPPDVFEAESLDADDWLTPASVGWGGDRWQLYGRGDQQVLLLATVWDSAEDAAEFAGAVQLPGPSSQARWEAHVVLGVGGEPPLRDTLLAAARQALGG